LASATSGHWSNKLSLADCLLLAALVSSLLVRLMIRLGALDHPVERSSHTAPTPKGGGVGIVAASLAGTALAGGWQPDMALVLAGALGLAAFSFLDDLRSRGFAVKLAVQAAAAACTLAAGWRAADLWLPGLAPLHPGATGGVLAIGWLLFVTNAVNFIDGLNGLAAGSAAIAAIALALAGGPVVPGLALAAGVAGFLPFNYPRARIFMGDVGSQFCGLLVGAIAVRAAAMPAQVLVVPLALAPILLDVAFTLLRRWRAGERITQPHRGHLYQVASRAGVPAAMVAAIYWVLAAWGGLCGALAGRAALATSAVGLAPLALLAAVLAVSLPMLSWGLYVARKAGQAGLTRW